MDQPWASVEQKGFMMKSKIITCSSTCIILLFCLFPQLAVGETIPEYQVVEKITRDISTPEKRIAAIAELSEIVKDSGQDMILRQFAAKKLGELEASEAKDMLKAIAGSLEWTDSTRQLKWTTFKAYWQIKVAEEPNEVKQVELLKRALQERFEGIIASNVQTWAADELANRGVKEALPEIINSIRHRNTSERGEEQIRLCKIKINLLNANTTRYEALTKALVMEDSNQYQPLKRWAIKELGKLRTDQSRWTLINYALELQNSYYDDNGKWIGRREDAFASYAGEFYRTIIKILKKADMTDAEIKDIGLRPYKVFIEPP
jgi:hypothetical protein